MDTLPLTPNDVPVGCAPAVSTTLRAATVTGRAGPWFLLDSHAERALQAQSCLLEPQAGDLVLVCGALPAQAAADGVTATTTVPYLLAVLTRAQPDAGTMMLPGGARIESADGDLRLCATRIALNGAEAVDASTRAFSLDAVSTAVTSHQASARIASLDAGIERLTLVARHFLSTVGRAIFRANDSSRWIEGNDELRAGTARWRVSGDAHLHTRHTTLVSDEMTRIDGSKIELG
ncbi:DUF3540 domain-containing protein [Caballeronia sp. GACF4]|uniref:DUF3540 domain-containing protein n=1 Tax=Caballeronia sp. GACF4 TaxID=2921763 RepID=UPI0020293585|nr:DUF3540 domain-containing protein [Caballeronia sp. GACF4]